MARPPVYAYLHGFLSSVASTKGRYLSESLTPFGIVLHQLCLNGAGGPSALTPARALGAVDACLEAAPEGTKLRLIGSSFGGWTAARYAELCAPATRTRGARPALLAASHPPSARVSAATQNASRGYCSCARALHSAHDGRRSSRMAARRTARQRSRGGLRRALGNSRCHLAARWCACRGASSSRHAHYRSNHDHCALPSAARREISRAEIASCARQVPHNDHSRHARSDGAHRPLARVRGGGAAAV